jgi:CRP/FNR family transcriptional regulator, cyclic AMP receptor protein
VHWPAGTFLGELRSEDRSALLDISSPRDYQAGLRILHEGDPSMHVLLLHAGGVKVSSHTAEGHETVLAVRGSGDIVGELAAIDERPRSATVSALTDVRALTVRWAAFHAFVAERPRVATTLLRVVADRVRESDRRRVDLRWLDARARIARELFDLVGRFGVSEDQSIVLALPISQREIAGLAGSSRETGAKAFRYLRQQGVVRTRRQRIVVVNPERLRQFAMGRRGGR